MNSYVDIGEAYQRHQHTHGLETAKIRREKKLCKIFYKKGIFSELIMKSRLMMMATMG